MLRRARFYMRLFIRNRREIPVLHTKFFRFLMKYFRFLVKFGENNQFFEDLLLAAGNKMYYNKTK